MRVEDKNTAAGVIQQLREFSCLRSVVVNSIQEIEEEVSEEQDIAGVETPENGTDVEEEKEVHHYIEFTILCSYYPNGYLEGEQPVTPFTEQTSEEMQQTEGQVE